MPFLLPMTPLIASLLGGGIAAGGSIAGGLLANRKSKEEKGFLTSQTSLADAQRERFNKLFGIAEPMIGKVGDFYSSLLSGDPKNVMRTLGPTFDQITRSFGAADESIMRDLPAGGEKNLARAGLRREQAAEFPKLVFGAQQLGAGGLKDLMGTLLGESGASGGNAANIYSSLLNYTANKQKALGEMGTGLGSSLGYLLFQSLMQGNTKGKSGGIDPTLFSMLGHGGI